MAELAWGRDPREVADKGPPKTISVEDSFRSCTTFAAIETVLRVLVPDLLLRLFQDRQVCILLSLIWCREPRESGQRLIIGLIGVRVTSVSLQSNASPFAAGALPRSLPVEAQCLSVAVANSPFIQVLTECLPKQETGRRPSTLTVKWRQQGVGYKRSSGSVSIRAPQFHSKYAGALVLKHVFFLEQVEYMNVTIVLMYYETQRSLAVVDSDMTPALMTIRVGASLIVVYGHSFHPMCAGDESI